LALRITWQLFSGITTLEALRPSVRKGSLNQPSSIFVCLPGSADTVPLVLSIPPEEHIYDLGPRENLNVFLRRPFIPPVNMK